MRFRVSQPPPCPVFFSYFFRQAYHDLWIGLLLAMHLRFILTNTTTYESIKGRRWVDNSTNGRPCYVLYPLNCFRFFFRPRGGDNVTLGNYGRLPIQVLKKYMHVWKYIGCKTLCVRENIWMASWPKVTPAVVSAFHVASKEFPPHNGT